jgi:hypothetical protein
MRAAVGAVTVAAAIAFPSSYTLGQANVQVAGKPSCASCRITLTPIATLKAPDTAEPIGAAITAMDSSGRFFVISQNREKVTVFDATGKFLRELGKRGAGPGEWIRLSNIAIGRADSILVVETTGRLTVLAPTFTYARSAQLPLRAFRLFPIRDGRFIAFAHLGPGGFNAHTIDGDRVARSFGWLTPPKPDPQCRACTDQRISAGPTDQTAWIAAPNRYSVERWNADGQLETHLDISQADWFEPWSTNQSVGDGITPKASTILGAYSDAAGRLWINGVHAPATWKPHALPAGLTASSGAIRFQSIEQITDYIVASDTVETETVIDVIDFGGKSVITRFRQPGSLTLLNSSIAAQPTMDADGNVELRVFRITLTERAP